MATGEEETSHEYEGGVSVGGKFRKRSNRSGSKPYNRPPNWISKSVVDPASRIISESAHKLFSLVFRKSLPPLTSTSTSTSEANRESSDAIPDQNQRIPSGDQEREVDEGGKVNSNSDSAINDLEQIFKHKTFTRAEIDRLTELLRSRTSDVYEEDEKRRFETSTSQPVEAPDKVENVPVQEDEVKIQTLFGTTSVSLSRSSYHDEDVASPTELAKAYMGSRSSKGTPSALNFHGQSFRQDVSRQTSVPFTPNSRALTVVQRASVPYASVPRGSESGYLTPVPQGRSALYNMARTPYSRVHHTAMLKVDGYMTKEKAGLLTSPQRSWKNNLLLSGGKQASKRSSSVLDSDIGSVGPIRRTRRKTNMMFSSESTGLSSHGASLPMPSTPIFSDSATGPILSTRNQFQLQGPKHTTSVRENMENGESSPASRRFVCVPNQSYKTAQKIFQQIEMIAPSPKGKSRETTTVVEASPSQSMPGVLDRQGIKSMGGIHSSKFMQTTQANGILDGLSDNSVIIARDLRSQKQTRFDEGGPSLISTSEDKLGLEAEGRVTRSTKDVISSSRTATAVMSSSVANVTEKKQDFAEKANKDSMEHQRRNNSSMFRANPLVTGKGKHNSPVVGNKQIDGDVTDADSFSCIRAPESFMLKNSSDTGSLDNHPASEKSPLISATSEVVIPDPSSSLSSPSLNRISTSNKPKSVRFSIASNAVDKVAPVASGSSGLNGAQSESIESKPKTVSSNDKNVEDGDLFEPLTHTVPSSKLASIQPGMFPFGASTNSSTSNGSPAFSPSNGLFLSPISTITATSTSIFTTSVSQFGPSTSVSTALSNSVSIRPDTSDVKSTNPELGNHNLNSSSFETKAFAAFTGASSRTPVLGASASSFQSSSTTAAASGSLSSAPAAPVTAGTPFLQSSPMQSGSSASSQTFGLSEYPLTSAGSGSITCTNSITSSTSTVPSLFGSSSQSATSSILSSQIDSKFSAAPTITNASASSSGPVFSFTSVGMTSTPPSSSFSGFGAVNPAPSFGSASTGNDQMSTEKSMNEHTALASTPVPSFSQPPSSPQPFSFVSGAPSLSGESNMFQFSNQQDPTTSQSPSPGFTMGAGGGDKSNRRFVKVRRDKLRKR